VALTTVSVAPLLAEAWELRNNLTVHDALYVVLTRRLNDAALVSTDRKLPNAPGVDVPVITPPSYRAEPADLKRAPRF
jgi:predicted nucleic acid-binding protein